MLNKKEGQRGGLVIKIEWSALNPKQPSSACDLEDVPVQHKIP